MQGFDISKLSPMQVAKILSACRKDPKFFSDNILGNAQPWQKQLEIMYSVRDHRRTCVKSCHASGKSWISARTALWFLQCWKRSIVVTTAPTFVQVEKILWGEIRDQFRRSVVPLSGEVLNTQIKISDKHYALGLSTDEGDRLIGFHADSVLVIIDEAPGVKEEMFESIEGLMTDSRCRLLMIGNPTSCSGTFYNAFKSPLYNKITISAYDTPNVIAGKMVVPGLVSKEWVEERKVEWGEQHPLFQSKVLGEFPADDQDTLIPLKYVDEAERRVIEEHGFEPKVLAIDVARFGDNDTVYLIRVGNTVTKIISHNGKKITEVIGRTVEIIKEHEPDVVIVDDVGIGGAVVDALSDRYANIYGFTASAKPQDDKKFLNLRAETYWNLSRRFRTGEIAIPKNTKLSSELPTIRVEYRDNGQIKIQSKRTTDNNPALKSPDYADALMMSEHGLKFVEHTEVKPRIFYYGRFGSAIKKQSNISRTGY